MKQLRVCKRISSLGSLIARRAHSPTTLTLARSASEQSSLGNIGDCFPKVAMTIFEWVMEVDNLRIPKARVSRQYPHPKYSR